MRPAVVISEPQVSSMKNVAAECERTNAARLDAAYEAARLALRIWSTATSADDTKPQSPPRPSSPSSSSRDALTPFRAEFPGKLLSVLEILKAIIDKVNTTVDIYKNELKVLRDRCIYVTCCVAVTYRRRRRRDPRNSFPSSPSSGGGVALRPLVECLKEVNVLAERCGGRQGRFWRALRASATERSIAELHRYVGALTKCMGLRGVVLVENKVDNLLPQLVSVIDGRCVCVRVSLFCIPFAPCTYESQICCVVVRVVPVLLAALFFM